LQNSFKEPYLVNYCCSNSEFLLECITKTKKDKVELYHLLENSKDIQDILNTIYRSFLKCGILNIVKSSTENPLDTSIHSISEKTIYLFMIKYGNFNNSLPIPEYLTSIISEKPTEFYNPKDELEDKILKLKENDFNYNSTDFQNALHQKHVFENTLTSEEDSEPVETINEIYESFIEEFGIVNSMTNRIEKLEKMILKYHTTYESFVTSNISTELTILKSVLYHSTIYMIKLQIIKLFVNIGIWLKSIMKISNSLIMDIINFLKI
jgi:ubiquinone/menaquinone biosynthesis C-methylase UbiE